MIKSMRKSIYDLKTGESTLEHIENIPVYLKIPMTTHYSGDLAEFDKDLTHVVNGTDNNETDKFGDKCACYYVSTVFGTTTDKEWLIREIAELGYNPTFTDFKKGLFKDMSRKQ